MADASLNESDAESAIAAQDRLVARLRRLDRAEVAAMVEAAAEATQCLAALAERGVNPVTEALGGASVVQEWAHFPAGDVVDPATHSLYFYHAHVAHERMVDENGHFHTFVRAKELYPDLEPAAPAPAGPEAANPVAHLVGISTDATGRLLRLFTVNRWVTGEAWYDADAVSRMLDRFDMSVEAPSHDLNRWVTAVVRLFRPQIVDLIRARDASVAEFKAAHPDRDVYDARDFRVTSQTPVDFLQQIRAIESVLGEAA
ncbi:MAG: hypothetical protein ABSC25_14115 [Roseiarcus sp.]|jgi:hypothetical protein